MRTSVYLSLLITFSTLDACSSRIWEMPVPEALQDCYNQLENASVSTYVGSVFCWYCEHTVMNLSSAVPSNEETTEYLNEICEKALESPYRRKRQASQCVRKEYRMLTEEERNRYHRAVNILKQDTSVPPNKYEAIANIHTGTTNLIAHGGPGFLGWHRVYLLIYETALQEVDPTVCIPYWDSTRDNQLTNPLSSTIWSDSFLGTPQGVVTRGPFANWRFGNGQQLMRNAGGDGNLLSVRNVQDILSRNSYRDIMNTRVPRYNFEQNHGSVHIYIGGSMSRLTTAPQDPIFFMHHCYMDYLWEQFRSRLKGLEIDPSVYPDIATTKRHLPDAPTGFPNYTQEDAYSEELATTVMYESVPSCTTRSPACGNRFLVCHFASGRCIPSTTTQVRVKRFIKAGSLEDTKCASQPSFGVPIQNDFCCNQICDVKEWAILPVKIVNMRPPNLQRYSSYPVRRGMVDSHQDIYSPTAYNKTRIFISSLQGKPKTYERCNFDTPVAQVFVYSQGINYVGYYKESAIVDQRLPVSISIGYVAVKKPSPGGITQALIRAHDSCGRVCQLACKDASSSKYTQCSGAIAISEEKPLMFAYTFDDAVMNAFDYKNDKECPGFATDNFYLTIYCDYHNNFPYAETDHK
ncbi:uncharacterized protein LOC106051404 [Biomphalaria glabrata]|uniref:Uncharacterized protein LOC106051404 n=1 Tax=Biomphalaria glabrata TaxID=6526 RepID=A0A9W3BCD9_BIOGL|nr:uncharacterized protein LOC106051404 [Biomphalaria glabrata]